MLTATNFPNPLQSLLTKTEFIEICTASEALASDDFRAGTVFVSLMNGKVSTALYNKLNAMSQPNQATVCGHAKRYWNNKGKKNSTEWACYGGVEGVLKDWLFIDTWRWS
ncbi:MAG: hypothetical protein C6Y22_08300 [Hapalosiphonaceae cyanobacterium JJU2]|nr:MAG: hypothetical protein C6Y22_08300 [Hapalosiphonaceae cyanobacterium JJU2]